MEDRNGPEQATHRASLRLVDPEVGEVWAADPAGDADDLDALTELFIGDETAGANVPGAVGEKRPGTSATAAPRPDDAPRRGRAGRVAPAEAATLEALITGHLPVRGTVWVRAYAARLARDLGEPVALIRVSTDRTAVELIGSSADSDPVDDLMVAIEAARSAADRWLLHFDELDQASLLRAGTLDRVTVLSGADEPAVVSAYRIVKTVAETSDGEIDAGISIVGSGEADTARATDRLVTAAKQFLGVDLAPRPSVPRIEAAAVTRLGDCDERFEPAAVVEAVLSAERIHRETIGFDLEPKPARPAPGRGSPGPVIERAVPAGDADAWGEAGRIPERMPDTTPDLAAEEESVDLEGDRPDPADLVPDLTPLGLPCPVAPGVSIAVDTAGRLHVLAWWSPEAPAWLLKAAAWARVNTPLLAAVRGGVRPDACAPAQHIVCTDLAVAADLRGTKTLVHLAHPVDRRPAHGWVCGRVN